MLFVADYGYTQATAGQRDPYQNLGVYRIYNNNWQFPGALPPDYAWSNQDDWYGTQSMPSGYEKAVWALDDINAYRESQGLAPFSENVLKMKISKPRFRKNRKR
jgi:hypothetical protein